MADDRPRPTPDTLRGSCHCGAVRFSITVPTLFCSHCHCDSCRRVHGAAFVTWTAVPVERFEIVASEGALVRYQSSSAVTRSFCGGCGCHVVYTSADTPDRVYVPVAVLLDPLDRAPQLHVNVAEAVSWCVLGDDLPRHDGFD